MKDGIKTFKTRTGKGPPTARQPQPNTARAGGWLQVWPPRPSRPLHCPLRGRPGPLHLGRCAGDSAGTQSMWAVPALRRDPRRRRPRLSTKSNEWRRTLRIARRPRARRRRTCGAATPPAATRQSAGAVSSAPALPRPRPMSEAQPRGRRPLFARRAANKVLRGFECFF